MSSRESRPRAFFMSSTALLPALIALATSALLRPSPAAAACVTAGTTTTCNTAAPNPWTTRVGNGNVPSEDNRIVDVQSGAEIAVGNDNAISLRDFANIHIGSGATVSATATTNPGRYSTGSNTIEFRNNGTLVIDQGGEVLALGTQNNAEPVNFEGVGNTLINSGTIRATNTVALWSQNTTGLNTVVNTETGIIQAPDQVIGGSGNGALDFTNRGIVIGSISLAGGDDVLRLFTGSTITGDFSGGGGTDAIFLSGTGEATLPGNFVGFETLTKNDSGTWTLSGTISGPTVTTVEDGVLALTGNNDTYTGQVIVDPAGTLEARAQSLPPMVTDNGLVRFVQPDAGTYGGLITGSGAVEKTGAGTLTLDPGAAGGNTYSGGTFLNEGTLAAGADNALGDPAGGLTFDGGTLQYNSSFDLAATRPITLNPGGGTFDTQGFETTIGQSIVGPGGLAKTGTGTLILTADNPYAGGTEVLNGTLAVGDAAHPDAVLSGGGGVAVAAEGTLGGYGSVLGPVTNAGTIAVANAVPAFADGPNGTFTIVGELQNSGLARIGGTGVGNVLSVGSYVGQNGTMAINTYLGDDDSPSDRLVIDGGTATGSTAISVTNVGGPGAPTLRSGILVVQPINGATTGAGAFSLAGPVSAGPYDYFLFKSGITPGTGENWYLRNTVLSEPEGSIPTPAPGTPPLPAPPPAGSSPILLYRPEVPTYAAVPGMEFALGRAMIGTFHQRRGDQYLLNGAGSANNAWGRLFGERTDRRWSGAVAPEFDGHLIGLQAGLDLYAYEASLGRGVLGVFVAHGEADGDVRGFSRGFQRNPSGRLSLENTAFGATWTHVGPTGWYLDALVMGQALGGSARSLRGFGVDTDGVGFAASLEGGYPLAVLPGLLIEPQAQFIWQHLSLDIGSDAFSRLDFGGTSLATGRLGLRVQGTFATDGIEWRPYALANLWHDFDETSTITFATTPIATKLGGTSVELGGGVVARLNDNVGLYGQASYAWGIGDTDQRALQGEVGLRVTW